VKGGGEGATLDPTQAIPASRALPMEKERDEVKEIRRKRCHRIKRRCVSSMVKVIKGGETHLTVWKKKPVPWWPLIDVRKRIQEGGFRTVLMGGTIFTYTGPGRQKEGKKHRGKSGGKGGQDLKKAQQRGRMKTEISDGSGKEKEVKGRGPAGHIQKNLKSKGPPGNPSEKTSKPRP